MQIVIEADWSCEFRKTAPRTVGQEVRLFLLPHLPLSAEEWPIDPPTSCSEYY